VLNSWFRLTILLTLALTASLAAALGIGRLMPTDEIAYAQSVASASDIYLLDANRHIAMRLTHSDQSEISPAWSPDGQQIAFLRYDGYRPINNGSTPSLYIMDWNGANQRRITDALTLTGSPALSWSPDGSEIAYTMLDDSGTQGVFRIRLSEREQSGQRLNRPQGNAFSPTWSPNGQLAFSWSPVANSEIYVLDTALITYLDSHTTIPEPRRITDNMYTDTTPSWSPDGAWIAFISDRGGHSNIYLARPDGSDLHPVLEGAARDSTPSWSPDGSRLVFVSRRNDMNDLYIIGMDGTDLQRITFDHYNENSPVWRPR